VKSGEEEEEKKQNAENGEIETNEKLTDLI
jgi:hypothetical protein